MSISELTARRLYDTMQLEQPNFVSEDDEIAYYDSMSEEDFLSEEESQKMMTAWKNLQLEKSRQEIHEGNCTILRSKEDINAYFESL